MTNNSIDTKTYILSLANEEYELMMILFESVIEFKLKPKNAISDFYYTEKFDLSTINDMKYLIVPLEDLKKAFVKFDRQFNKKRVKLIKLREDTINLNFRINVDDEDLETNLELKQFKINKEVGYTFLSNTINEMSKKIKELEKNLNTKIDIMYEDYLKNKNEEEIKKRQEEEKQKKEEIIRQEEEKKLNDNVNLINDFQSKNIDMKEFYSISNEKFYNQRNTVAVYPIIRNNERLYELDCVKRGYDYHYNIVIYNILLNKKTNVIYNAHCKNNNNSYANLNGQSYYSINYYINNLKHYYYSSKKKHFLLSSNGIEIKLWNISSNIITNELKITAENHTKFDKDKDTNILDYYYIFNCSCLLFNEDNYIIFGETYSYSNSKGEYKTKIFNGNFQNNIGQSKLKSVNYIEATYIGDKSFILLAGDNAESYNYNDNILIEYKPYNQEIKENQKIYIHCINLFNKNNKIYLIASYSDGRVVIFDFNTGKEKGSITVGESGKDIYGFGLCSLNEKYFLAGINKEIKVIDFDKRSIRNYENLDDDNRIKGIEKIKIPDKGEFIISYTERVITLWKLNN